MNSIYCSKRVLLGILISMFISSLLIACWNITEPVVSTQTSIEEQQVFNNASYITANSMQELIDKSVIIIIGKAVSTGEVINLARDVDDLSKPDPNLFGIGQVYEFEVTRYLKDGQKGNDFNPVYVVQFEGIINLVSQTPPTKNDLEKAREQEKYIPISIGSSYFLFLRQLKGVPELKGYYTGVAQPWRFVLLSDCVYPESPWYGVSFIFKPLPMEDFIRFVENPQKVSVRLTEASVYPNSSDMTSSSICPNISSYEIPYP